MAYASTRKANPKPIYLDIWIRVNTTLNAVLTSSSRIETKNGKWKASKGGTIAHQYHSTIAGAIYYKFLSLSKGKLFVKDDVSTRIALVAVRSKRISTWRRPGQSWSKRRLWQKSVLVLRERNMWYHECPARENMFNNWVFFIFGLLFFTLFLKKKNENTTHFLTWHV